MTLYATSYAMLLFGGIFLIIAGIVLAVSRIRDYQDNFLGALGEDLRDTITGASWPLGILVIFALGVGLVVVALLG